MQSTNPRIQIGKSAAKAEGAGDFTDEAHLNVSSTKLVAHQILHPIERSLDIAQVIGNLAVDT